MSWFNQPWIMSLKMNEAKVWMEQHGEVEHKLGKISPVYNDKSFCDRLIGSVNIAMTY